MNIDMIFEELVLESEIKNTDKDKSEKDELTDEQKKDLELSKKKKKLYKKLSINIIGLLTLIVAKSALSEASNNEAKKFKAQIKGLNSSIDQLFTEMPKNKMDYKRFKKEEKILFDQITTIDLKVTAMTGGTSVLDILTDIGAAVFLKNIMSVHKEIRELKKK